MSEEAKIESVEEQALRLIGELQKHNRQLRALLRKEVKKRAAALPPSASSAPRPIPKKET